MKKTKRIMCLLLALMLILGMSMTAFAEEDVTGGGAAGADEQQMIEVTPTYPNDNGNGSNYNTHTYAAYQIFKGTQVELTDDADDDTAKTAAKLASIDWGSGVDGESLQAALEKLTEKDNPTIGGKFKGVTSAAGVAGVVSTFTDGSDEAFAFARFVSDYLTTASETFSGTDQISLPAGYYLIVDMTDADDMEDGDAYNLSLLQLTQDGAFEIKNKTDVPTVIKKVQETNDTTDTTSDWQDAADYDIGDEVTFQLTGTLPANYDDYETYYYAFHDTLSAGLTYNNDVVVTINTDEYTEEDGIFTVAIDGTELTITFEDLKDSIPDLTATSTIVVTYTATLNDGAVIGSQGNPNEVYLEYSNNPNVNGEGTGNTPKDKVIVFTYELDVYKVMEDSQTPLAGAGFTLYKWIPGVTETDQDDEQVNDDTDESSNATGTWEPVGNEITGVTTFVFKGIDAGKYKLEETTVPLGYNKADDIYFEISATYSDESDDPSLTDLTCTVTDEAGKSLTGEGTPSFTITTTTNEDSGIFSTNGIISTNVVNMSGITLPETGGIGTRIFYVIGGILVVGCGVILVTRRRVNR